jgi:FixJ family two-component response regulator
MRKSSQCVIVLRRCAVLALILRKEIKVSEIPVISIVDDDLSVREATSDLMRAMGFAAVTYQNADDFLASDRRHHTSCLIADMRMPGMSGLALHNRLVEAGTPIPTILITAFPNDKDQASALQAGVVGYLTKPFNENELLAFIHSILKNPKIDERE